MARRKITEVALEQRMLWNRFAREALNDSYDHNANYESIAEASQPVLSSMREDLESPE